MCLTRSRARASSAARLQSPAVRYALLKRTSNLVGAKLENLINARYLNGRNSDVIQADLLYRLKVPSPEPIWAVSRS